MKAGPLIMEFAVTAAEPISLWDRTAEERDVEVPLDTGRVVDVAIVGGGFTGLSTALHCAEKGLSAHLIEAERLGHGGSGRNVGLVNAAAWLPPAQVRAALGGTYGPRFVERFSAAPAYVFSLIERHQMRCEARREGTIHAAHAPSGFRDLQSRHAEWQRLGEPVDLLGPAEVAAMTGSPAFHGGLWDHRAGTINPMGYVRGLARAALAAGAKISTGVRATKIARDGDHWRVDTDRGAITARNVVLGTNAYTDRLWPGLTGGYTRIGYFQLATEPLGARADAILPGGQGLWDTGTIMRSLRKDAGGRLVIGSMGRMIGTAQAGLSRRWAARQMRAMFPDLGPVDFVEGWDGDIAMTPDHLPRIHVLAPGVYTAIGYNGRGITTGTVFGQAMADLLTGMDPSELPLPVSAPTRVATAPVMERLYALAFAANQVARSL